MAFSNTTTSPMEFKQTNITNGDINFLTSNTERMTILHNGNVGINDAIPNYTLDVAGDINFTGNLRSNGTIWDPTPVITNQ